MKSRKLISFLGAAAMAASAFSGLTLTASAAEGDLFSFDGSSKTGWTMENGTISMVEDENGSYLTLKGGGSGQRNAIYNFDGITGIDDGYVIEFDSLIHGSDGQGRESMTTQIAFVGSNVANDTRTFGSNTGEGVGTGFAVKYDTRRSYQGGGIVINDPATEVVDDWTTYSGYVSDTQNKWLRTQAVVSDNSVTITIIDSAGTKIVDSQTYACDAEGLTGIRVGAGRGDSTPGDAADPGYVYLDNIRVYTGEAQTLTTDGLRGEAEIITPATSEPTVAPAVAPAIVAPETDAVSVMNDNFNGYDIGTLISMTSETQEAYTGIEGLSIAVGSRNDGDTTSYASIDENVTADNVLKLASGRFSNGSKGPVVTLTNNLAIDAEDDPTSVMAFAVKLSSTGTVPGKMYLLDNITNVDGNSVGRDIMAVLTTETDASGYVNGDTGIGVSLEADKWYSVVVTVSPDSNATAYGTGKIAATYRVYVFDSTGANVTGSAKDPVIKGEKVNAGNTSVSVNNLPVIATAQTKDALGSGNASIGVIDNLITYTTTSTEFEQGKALPSIGSATEPEEPEPTATPAPVVTMTVDETAQSVSLTSDVDATVALVQASYVTDGTLDSIKVVPVTLTADTADVSTVADGDLDAFQTNDKFMVVDSLDSMRPLSVAYTVSGGAEQTTPAPIPTVEATTEPTEVASAEPTEVASAEPTEDADITLVHTGYVTSGSSMGTAGVSIDTADGNELFNSWGGGSASAYGQVAYAQFTIGDDVPTEGVASLDFTVTITGAADDSNARTTSVYLMPDTFPSLDEIGDDTTVTAQGTLLGNIEGTVGEATAYTFKITDQTTIETILGQDKVILGVTDRGKGGSMAGINSTTPPTLTLVEGEQVTLTTKVGGTATAGITVKIDGVEYTSDDNGVISLLLPVGDHTYEVEAGVYEAIAATSFTVATETGYTGDINLTESSVTVVADREVPGGVTSLYEWPTTTERGESTILYPTVTRVNFSEQTEETYTDFTLDFDICVLDGQAVSMGAQKANNLGTMLSFSGANGVLTLNAVESTSSSKAIAPAEGNLATGTWYNVKAEYTTVDNVTNGITVTVSSVDEAGTVGAQVAQLSGIATRNNDKGAYDNVNFNEVTGAPMLNNIYVYKTAAAAE